MTTWILFILIGSTSSTAGFATEESCINARVEVSHNYATRDTDTMEEYAKKFMMFYGMTLCLSGATGESTQ